MKTSQSEDLNRKVNHFLPITRKEIEFLGWDYVDVILISGDAYVDHPSFAAAVIGRVLEQQGLRVAILPQPNWRDDLRDFKKLGAPRLFFGITAGNMDSMVNHYTAYKRLRSDDAYTAGNVAGFRPDYASVVYTKIVKQLFPNIPVILGGVEEMVDCRVRRLFRLFELGAPQSVINCEGCRLIDAMIIARYAVSMDYKFQFADDFKVA